MSASTLAPTARSPALPGTDMRAWNEGLNQTHAMSTLREAGWIVRAIEARRRRTLAALVATGAPARVLDVGCEDGWLAEAYVDAVGEVALADIDPHMLARSALAQREGVRVLAADATAPAPLRAALGDGWAETLVLSALLEHLPDPREALQGLLPLVAPGGRVVIYLPADRPILWCKAFLRHTRLGGLIRGLPLTPAPGHLHMFSRGGIRRLVAGCGTVERLAFDPLCLGWTVVLRRDA